MKNETILKNAAKCDKCGDVIESKDLHDFKTCSCGNVSVDGGHYYLRRCINDSTSFTDLSVILKPCPFCGGKASVKEGGAVKYDERYYVICNDNYCRGGYCHSVATCHTPEEAIELLNRRCFYE